MLRGVELGKVKVSEVKSREGIVVDEEDESAKDVAMAMEKHWLVECFDSMKII
jgi:CBS domain-containing protein